jgi:hypothetical protein
MESSCVVVALVENYSTSVPLKVAPEKLHIFSCDTVVAKEQFYVLYAFTISHVLLSIIMQRVYLEYACYDMTSMAYYYAVLRSLS